MPIVWLRQLGLKRSFTSGNIIDGGWKCRNLFRKCGNVDNNIEIYFRNVEMSQEIYLEI